MKRACVFYCSERGVLYVLCVIAWGLSIVAIADCSFLLIEVDGNYYDGSTNPYSTNPPSYNRKLVDYKEYDAYGAFSYDADREEHYCVPYTDAQIDQYFNTAGKAGRAFGVVATVFSGMAFALITAVVFVLEAKVDAVWKTSIFLISCAVPSQLLTFLTMLIEGCQDAKTCIPGIAGGASFTSAILFVIIAVMMGCCVKPPTKPLVSISDMRRQNKKLG